MLKLSVQYPLRFEPGGEKEKEMISVFSLQRGNRKEKNTPEGYLEKE